MHHATPPPIPARCLSLVVAILSVAAGSSASPPSVSSQCLNAADECSWSEGFNVAAGFDGDVLASAVWDDGTGPSLYVGGSFRRFGTESMSYLAKWDGQRWTAVVDTTGLSVSGTIRFLLVFDDGTGEALFAGGDFQTAGGQPANHIARWDGNNWSALTGPNGNGIDGSIGAMVVHDDGYGDSLYVGGEFVTAGGVVANNIARWDGMAWGALSWIGGIGIDGTVTALAVFYGQLVAGGGFRDPGGLISHYFASWNGYWTPIEGPALDEPYTVALAEFDDGGGNALYAVGELSNTAIARWDGVAWSPVTNSVGLLNLFHSANWISIETISQSSVGGEPALFIGGSACWSLGSLTGSCTWSSFVIRWDGNDWSFIADGTAGIVGGGTVATLTSYEDGSSNALYAGGRRIAHGDEAVGDVGRWDGTGWTGLSDPPGNGLSGGSVAAFARFDDGRGEALFAAGDFSIAGGEVVGHIARWDGSKWEPLTDEGGNGTCSVLSCNTPAAVVAFADGGGESLWIGAPVFGAYGHTTFRLASWDGVRWSLRGSSPGGYDSLNDMTVYDDGTGPAIFVCGVLDDYVDLRETVMKFTHGEWASLPGFGEYSEDGEARTFGTWDDGGGEALYIAGHFNEAAGMVVNGVIRWDGVTWSALGGPSGVGVGPGTVHDMAIFDDGEGEALYVAGEFTDAGGIHVNNIAKWDGHRWWALEGPNGIGTNDSVRTLGIYDDGRGEDLYMAGAFTTAGGVIVDGLARWDGQEWSAACPQGASYSNISTLEAHDDGSGEALFAGGHFQELCGVSANNIARLNCPHFDFGDAPEPPYATLLAEDGARHVVNGSLHLGEGVSHEPDGKPSVHADGDDLDDGVEFASPMIPGFAAQIEVRSSADAVLDAWIDVNADGDWDDPGERIFDHQPVVMGANLLPIEVPTTAVVGATTIARFRLSSTGVDTPTGEALDGEVEDYEIEISVNPTRPSGGRRRP